MIVEGFDNAWHILRRWAEDGYAFFALEMSARVPQPQPLTAQDVPKDARLGVDYFPLPALADPAQGDNPDPERPLTLAEVALATAIAEGWEPETQAGN